MMPQGQRHVFGNTLFSMLPHDPISELLFMLRGFTGLYFVIAERQRPSSPKIHQDSESRSNSPPSGPSSSSSSSGYQSGPVTYDFHWTKEVIINEKAIAGYRLFGDELEWLTKFTTLATKSYRIQTFVAANRFNIYDSYVSGVAQRIEECMKGFDRERDECYENNIKFPQQPLGTYSNLLSFEHLFDVLLQLVDIVSDNEKQTMIARSLLEFLKEINSSGWKDVQQVLPILNQIARPFHYDLWNWLIYGTLPFTEMDRRRFIIEQNSTKPEMGSSSPKPKSPSSAVSDNSYQLIVKNLPPRFSLRIADKILFTGQSVKLTEEREDSRKENAFQTHFAQLVPTDQLETIHAEYLDLTERKLSFTSRSTAEFETFLEKLHRVSAKLSWDHVTKQFCLFEHLERIKSILLVGREDLFTDYISRVERKVLDVGCITVHHASYTFRRAVEEIMNEAEGDSLFEQFKFKFPTDGNRNLCQRSEIQVDYKALPDALRTIIRPDSFVVYNEFCNVLVDLLKARSVLCHTWRRATRAKRTNQRDNGSGDGASEANDIPVWSIRHKLSIILERTYYFFKVNVCETLFQRMMCDMSSLADYEALGTAHSRFIVRLRTESLIAVKPVRKALYDLIDLTYELPMPETGPDDRIPTGKDPLSAADFIYEFRKRSVRLRYLLLNIRAHEISPSLRALYEQIDSCLERDAELVP